MVVFIVSRFILHVEIR